MNKQGVDTTVKTWNTTLDSLKQYATKEQWVETGDLKKEISDWQKGISGTTTSEVISEWQQRVDAWVAYIKPVSMYRMFVVQLITLIIMYGFTYTPLSSLFYVYVASMPLIWKVQGEMWKNGMGQYIRLEVRDRIDVLLLFVLTIISCLGIYGMKYIFKKNFTWFITAFVVYTFIVNTFGADIVYWLVNMMYDMSMGDLTELQQADIKYRYGWNYIHLPIILTIAASGMGQLAFQSLHLIE